MNYRRAAQFVSQLFRSHEACRLGYLASGIYSLKMPHVSRRHWLNCCAGAMLSRWTTGSRAVVGDEPLLAFATKSDQLLGKQIGSMAEKRTQFFTTADGRRLCFAEWARPDGTPVILFHGSLGCRLGVSAQTETLLGELGVRLITYDRPGYGGSVAIVM